MRKLSRNPLREAILKCLVVGGMAATMNTFADCNVIYGVHDAGLNNSQIVKINRETYAITPLGAIHSGHDIEGLDMNAAGELYGSSGDDPEGNPAGQLYKISTADGSVKSVGPISFELQGVKIKGTEVSALSFNPINDDLWAWSEECGLVKVDINDPANSTLEMPYSNDEFVACLSDDQKKRQKYTSTIEDISWSADGKKIYYANGDKVYVYTPSNGSIAGPLSGEGLGGNVETVEILPDSDKTLLLVVDGSPQLFELNISTDKVSKIDGSDVRPYTDIEAVAACVDPIEKITCDNMDFITFAKFNVTDGSYVADSSATNNSSIVINANENGGTWTATDANITHVVVNTTDATNINNATNINEASSGTFSDSDGVTTVEFCGTPVPPPVVTCANMDSSIFAKFNWNGEDYVADDSADNNSSINIIGTSSGGVWTVSDGEITHVVINSTEVVNIADDTLRGSFGDADGITTVEFCGTPVAPKPPEPPQITSCPDEMGSLVAKFEWNSGYDFEKPTGNDDVVIITGDAESGTWSTTNANISYVILKGGPNSGSYAPTSAQGEAFSNTSIPVNGGGNVPDISNIQFCGTMKAVVDCVIEEPESEWLYATDAVGDASGFTKLEIYSTAIKQDGDTITVAINSNMTPEDPLYFDGKKINPNGENVNFTDYVFDFSGTQYAVHFAPDNDSGANAGVGLYEVTEFKDVTKKNYGYKSFKHYDKWIKNSNLGDLPIHNDYFSWDTQRSIPQEIASGTKVANDNYTRLNEADLAAMGLNFSGQTGTYTFGFSFTKTAEMEGDFVSYVFTECINDGIALVNTLPAAMETQSCPNDATSTTTNTSDNSTTTNTSDNSTTTDTSDNSTAVDTDYVAPINPTAGSATVDGDISEWDLTADLSAHMCTAGSVGSDGNCAGNGKVNLSDLYSRYDCENDTMHVLVLENDPYQAEKSDGDAWVTIGGNRNKVVKGGSSSFSWVEDDNGRAIGYEASFPLAAGTHEDVQVHLNVSNNTSSTGKNGDTAKIITPSSCDDSTSVDTSDDSTSVDTSDDSTSVDTSDDSTSADTSGDSTTADTSDDSTTTDTSDDSTTTDTSDDSTTTDTSSDSTAVDTDYVAPINPTAGSATVDGDISEWNLDADLVANMCTAGSVGSDGNCAGSGKVNLSDLYSRYDCETDTMHVLVLENDPYQAEKSDGDAWVTIGGNRNKVVKGGSSSFSWVEDNTGRAIGYEASFPLAAGTHEDVQVHLNVSNNTSSTGKNGDTAKIITPACPE